MTEHFLWKHRIPEILSIDVRAHRSNIQATHQKTKNTNRIECDKGNHIYLIGANILEYHFANYQ